MKRTGAFIFGVLPLLAATTAYAQAQVPQAGGAVRAPQAQAPYTLPGEITPPGGSELPPIVAKIGEVPVRVWAPVPPPYDPLADRTGASDPIPTGPDWWPVPPPLAG